MAEERSFLYALGDNVVGFEDDYDSLGERGARALREDPVGILSTIASSLKDSAVQLGRDVKKDPLAALNTRLQDAGETYYGASKNLTKGLSGYLDQGLSVEEARDQQLVDALTVSELLGMGFGTRALTKAGSAALKKTDTDEISDSSRRKFMKGVGATGIAALAPQVVTEALEKVPAAVKVLKPVPNPIDIFTQNMKILRREMEEAYDAADDMPVGMQREAYDEAIQNAEKLAYDLDATTEMDLRELISDIGPKQIAEAADESLEEISQALTDFRMVSEDEYIEQMIPLAEEIQRRGLLEVKDNGIPQYPYARTVVEDVEDYFDGENRAGNNSAVIDRTKNYLKPPPRDLKMMEADKYVTSNQQLLKQEQLKNIIIKGKDDGDSVDVINKKVVDAATRLKVPYPQRAFEDPKVEYVDTQTIADNVAQYNYPRYDVGTFGGDFESGDMGNMPGYLAEFQASGKETLKENIFNEGIKEPIEIEVTLKDGGISIGQGHHRLQAALELGMPKIPVVVRTEVNPRFDPAVRPATIDTSGLKKFQTYSFSELGLEKRLKTSKETPEEIKARSGTVFEDYETGALSDRKFSQYETPMREGFFRVVDEKADGGEMRKGVGSLSEIARRMNEGGEAKIYIPTQEDLDKMALRVKKTYGFDPVKEALNEGVDPDLALRIMMRESSGDHSRGSDKGAIGLMGLMPITAEDVGVDRTDPYENYVGGLRYLKKMQARFGDVVGIAAYNAGPTAVEKYEGIPPFAETQAYVRAVLTPFTGVDYEDQIQEDAETALMQMPVEMASNVMKRPFARPPVTYDGPQPMQRPTLPQDAPQQEMIKLAVQEVVQPQSLQQKYSPQGIEQMLTGTIGEPLLPRQFQQGSPYSSMR